MVKPIRAKHQPHNLKLDASFEKYIKYIGLPVIYDAFLISCVGLFHFGDLPAEFFFKLGKTIVSDDKV